MLDSFTTTTSIYNRWLALRIGCVVLLASVVVCEHDVNNEKRSVPMSSIYDQDSFDVLGTSEFLNARPSRYYDLSMEKRAFDDGTSMPGVLRFGKRSQSFIRFGKRALIGMLDKKEMPGVLRFGKRGGEMIGDDESTIQIKKNVPGVLRFGKRGDFDVPGVLRFGKRGDFDVPGVLRFGKRAGGDDFDVPGVLRFGKKSEMPGVLRFGKRAMPGVLRFGR